MHHRVGVDDGPGSQVAQYLVDGALARGDGAGNTDYTHEGARRGLASVLAAASCASLQVLACALEHGDQLEELLVVEAYHQATLDKGHINHLLLGVVRDHVKVVLVNVVVLVL